MNARIVAIGSELLTPFRQDTNSLVITGRLNEIGCRVVGKSVVGDDTGALAAILRSAIGVVDLVVCTGGLGPTADDITREAIGKALDVPLTIDESILDMIRARFERRGMKMADINRRQAMVPGGAVVLHNAHGTAPGLWIVRDGTAIMALPGPPREMTPMLDTVIRERVAPGAGGRKLFRRVIKIAGRTESEVDARVQPIYGPWSVAPLSIDTTILAALGQIELHLSVSSADEGAATGALDAAVTALHEALGDAVYSVDGRPLEAVVGELLVARGMTLAVAESCTGGLLASRLTDVPGSSAYLERAAVCYSNASKVEWLDVSEALLAEQGAVSEPVARAMAEGIRLRARTSVGIGITGIAGPGGGSPQKPVGTVAIAVVVDEQARVQTFRFIGERAQVKSQAAQTALNLLRLMLVRGAAA